MKTIITLLALFLAIGIPILGQDDTETEDIKKAVLNYIEGWYDGDVARMEKALHPDLAKRNPVVLKQTGGEYMQSLTKSMMMEYTRAGFGKQTPREKLSNKVTVFDVYKGIATVKVVSYDFVDYCQLVKQNGEWKIINVLWESNPHEENK